MNTTLVQFTLLIPVNNRLREFNFRKRSEERYDCNIADERNDRYYFQLTKMNNDWTMEDAQLPAWLRSSNTTIIQALVKKEMEE